MQNPVLPKGSERFFCYIKCKNGDQDESQKTIIVLFANPFGVFPLRPLRLCVSLIREIVRGPGDHILYLYLTDIKEYSPLKCKEP